MMGSWISQTGCTYQGGIGSDGDQLCPSGAAVLSALLPALFARGEVVALTCIPEPARWAELALPCTPKDSLWEQLGQGRQQPLGQKTGG